MKSRPILMNVPMVKALLDGRKSQTRRVVKPQPPEPCVLMDSRPGGQVAEWASSNHGVPFHSVHCPYGSSGDLLWVRETWATNNYGFPAPQASISYKAGPDGYQGLWRPSIHMPRWASRITLCLDTVRVERLQDASRRDIASAGCPYTTRESALSWFRFEWDVNYAQRGYSWETNPWVWVLQFDVILQNVDIVVR